MNCEICGRGDAVYKSIVEGSELFVCEPCGKFGKRIANVEQQEKITKVISQEKKHEDRFNEIIIDKYGEIIKNAREKNNISQEEFAKKINEKVSIIHKIETNSFEPSIELAKKIERFLKIHLIVNYEVTAEKPTEKNHSKLTLGDVVKIKKK